MKFSTQFLYYPLLALTALLCSLPSVAHGYSVTELERRFIRTLDYQKHNETVKLVGYKSIIIPEHTRVGFEKHYYENVKIESPFPGFDATFYDRDNSILRVYFPVAKALVEHDGVLIEANEFGEFDVEELVGDYSVVGRKKTEHVYGVEGNIIENGIIYLAEKPQPTHRHGKVFIYDFGYKSLDHGHHHHEHHQHDRRDSPNRGCVANHGGVNCSVKYGIRNGRCPFVPTTCMDYNGYFTSCKKVDKFKYFIGSDCFTSVSRGNCWNEVEAAI